MSSSEWYLINDSKYGSVIRRREYTGDSMRWRNYPSEKYRHLPQSEIEALVRRLNATAEQKRKEAEARYDYDHAFINVKTLEAFEKYLKYKSDNHGYISDMLQKLNDHSLQFFINKKKLPNPIDWADHQYELGERLLKSTSLSTTRKVNMITNQFLDFLKQRYKDEIVIVPLAFVSKAKADALKAKKELEEGERRRYISTKEFSLIQKHAGEILPHINLGYAFGLRCAEVMGLEASDDVYKNHLQVRRQIVTFNATGATYKPTKGKMKRTIPYWYMKPAEAYKAIQQRKLMHPDTLSDKFLVVIKTVERAEKVRMDYTFHDLRHTFITNAVRKHSLRDVQLAAGHKSMATTEGYLQDDRERNEEKFVPN